MCQQTAARGEAAWRARLAPTARAIDQPVSQVVFHAWLRPTRGCRRTLGRHQLHRHGRALHLLCGVLHRSRPPRAPPVACGASKQCALLVLLASSMGSTKRGWRPARRSAPYPLHSPQQRAETTSARACVLLGGAATVAHPRARGGGGCCSRPCGRSPSRAGHATAPLAPRSVGECLSATTHRHARSNGGKRRDGDLTCPYVFLYAYCLTTVPCVHGKRRKWYGCSRDKIIMADL